MPQKKQGLKDIRTSLLSRGFALAKAAVHARRLNQIEPLIQELGKLKGSAMKVGQILSLYGEHFWPKEITDLLKILQQNSAALEWSAIETVLSEELGSEKLLQLEVDEIPLASASIGQVHRARIKSTGELIVLKVQYPGVDRAIQSDLKLLKFVLTMADLIPKGPRFDQIFSEIREMLEQEADYTRELRFLETFHDLLKDDSRYVIPKPIGDYSTRRVLAMEFVSGVRADSAEVQELDQDRRNQLGLSFFDLYLRELLEIRLMQTDPHLGNYTIQIDADGGADKLVLFDFGAVREVPLVFLNNYMRLIDGGIHGNDRKVEQAGRQLKLLLPEDSLELVMEFTALCYALIEPFDGLYDWGESDLPKRLARQAGHMITSYKLRAPPRELVFLDRKLGGVFIFLSVLKCKMDSRELLLSRLTTALQLDGQAVLD